MKLVEPGVLDRSRVVELQGWAARIQSWPAGSHLWGQYAERTPSGEVICRTENVSACHTGVATLVEGPLRELAAARLGEPATPFKDKLNYKQPGGAGFSPHQDLVAYPGLARVLSLLVAIDECSEESGCLWISGATSSPLETDERGVLRQDLAARLAWAPALLAPGDVLVIDGLAPHYSEANRSDRPRRVLVASYAPTAERYDRAGYYDGRRLAMEAASRRDGRSRISTLADFEGEQVAPPAAARHACTHG